MDEEGPEGSIAFRRVSRRLLTRWWLSGTFIPGRVRLGGSWESRHPGCVAKREARVSEGQCESHESP